MSKRIKKKTSSKTSKSRRTSESEKPAACCSTNMWKTSTIVLGVLLVISVFTGGFGIGSDDDNDVNTFGSVWKTLFGPKETVSDAKVTIIEYSDFQCPYCARAYETVNQILEEHGDNVAFDYRHFPLSNHPQAQKAAEASECARDQDKFKEYHDVLFETKLLTVDNLKKHAVDLGLNTGKFNSCLDDGDKADIVKADFLEGQQKGVRGTPTFFINDFPVVGAQPFANLKEVIDKALAGEKLEVPAPEPAPEPEPVVKSDKPEVELFVMSHCPYGTQMEKGMLPVVNLLKDDIDFDLKFVYYAMHGEIEVVEQLNQYCIQENEEEKLIDYLLCFLEDGDGEKCLADLEIDMDALETCKTATDEEFELTANLEDKSSWLSGRFPLFNTHKEDNEKYGVRGSPSLVINGQSVSSNRDSASLLKAVCERFNDQPEACSTVFESGNPTPGFGFDETALANNAAAGCGV